MERKISQDDCEKLRHNIQLLPFFSNIKRASPGPSDPSLCTQYVTNSKSLQNYHYLTHYHRVFGHTRATGLRATYSARDESYVTAVARYEFLRVVPKAPERDRVARLILLTRSYFISVVRDRYYRVCPVGFYSVSGEFYFRFFFERSLPRNFSLFALPALVTFVILMVLSVAQEANVSLENVLRCLLQTELLQWFHFLQQAFVENSFCEYKYFFQEKY